VIAGPSGVGKGSIVRRLLERDPGGLVLSVSATTRPPRPLEVQGRDYRFVDAEAFASLIGSGALLEWAEVFGDRYGTPADPVDEARAAGHDVILEIDVQGAKQVRERVPDAILVFVAPPSLEELERRLRSRGTESEDRIRRRLETAEAELARTSAFDHVVVNDDLEAASSQVAAIIEASRSDPDPLPRGSDPEGPAHDRTQDR
jgi:guanylate kinase